MTKIKYTVLLFIATCFCACGAGAIFERDDIQQYCPSERDINGYYTFSHNWIVSTDSLGNLVLTCARCKYVEGSYKETK